MKTRIGPSGKLFMKYQNITDDPSLNPAEALSFYCKVCV